MPSAGLGERAEQVHMDMLKSLEPASLPAFREKSLPNAPGPHCVGAGRPYSNFEDIEYANRFHLFFRARSHFRAIRSALLNGLYRSAAAASVSSKSAAAESRE